MLCVALSHDPVSCCYGFANILFYCVCNFTALALFCRQCFPLTLLVGDWKGIQRVKSNIIIIIIIIITKIVAKNFFF